MPVERDFAITIDRDELLQRQKGAKVRPELLEAVDWAIARALQLVRPQVAYSIYKSEGVQGEELRLEGGVSLRLGPHADLAGKAQEVIVSVATIGPALEAEARQLMAGGEALKGYVLDCAGVVAVGQAAAHMRALIEEWAAQKGWGVSPSLYPGSPMGWPTRGQRELVALVPVAEIGVTLNTSCMLVPQKSSSSLVGMGPEYERAGVSHLCHWCALQESCWRRKSRVKEAQPA